MDFDDMVEKYRARGEDWGTSISWAIEDMAREIERDWGYGSTNPESNNYNPDAAQALYCAIHPEKDI